MLGALDDKIELNRKMNKTLEAMAQAIFKSWFVDFEPFRDGGMVDSELVPIPKGWEVGVLSDVLVLQRGFDLPKSKRRAGNIPILTSGGVNDTHNDWKVKGPGVVTGRSGKLGNVFIVQEDFWPLNTTLWVKEFKHSGAFHAYQLLRSLGLERFNAGSAVPTLNRNHVHNLPTLIPPVELVESYEKVASSFFDKIRHNSKESNSLTELRDTLLPMLISGEVRIKDAEPIVRSYA